MSENGIIRPGRGGTRIEQVGRVGTDFISKFLQGSINKNILHSFTFAANDGFSREFGEGKFFTCEATSFTEKR